MHTKLLSFSDLPRSLAIVKTYDAIQAEFPGSSAPAEVVVSAPKVTTPTMRSAFVALKRRALATGQIHEPISVAFNPARTVARIDMPLAGNETDAAAYDALNTLRRPVIPPVLAALPARTEMFVTGETAGSYDFNHTMKHRVWFVFAFVLGLAFVLLLLTFRSIVIPIKAILLNLLSVGAAYGVLVWIFQDGHLQGARIPIQRRHRHVAAALPLHRAVRTLDGLPHLHPDPRQRTRRPRHPDRRGGRARHPQHSVNGYQRRFCDGRRFRDLRFAAHPRHQADGYRPRGRRPTDATLVRGVLLPAAMKLLGEWNWYLPRWLNWMPRLTFEPELGGRRIRVPLTPLRDQQ